MRAHPGASGDGATWDGETLHVYVTEHAVEGSANRAVLKAVARALGVRAHAVTLVSGHRTRNKVFEVEGAVRRSGSAPPG